MDSALVALTEAAARGVPQEIANAIKAVNAAAAQQVALAKVVQTKDIPCSFTVLFVHFYVKVWPLFSSIIHLLMFLMTGYVSSKQKPTIWRIYYGRRSQTVKGNARPSLYHKSSNG